MESDAALTLRLDGDRSGSGLERLHESLLGNPALRMRARPELVRRAAGQNEMSGWVGAMITFGPLVLSLPTFVRDLKSGLDFWFRTDPGTRPLTLEGPRGTVTVTGELTDEQFAALLDTVLPVTEEAPSTPEGDAGDAGAAAAS